MPILLFALAYIGPLALLAQLGSPPAPATPSAPPQAVTPQASAPPVDPTPQVRVVFMIPGEAKESESHGTAGKDHPSLARYKLVTDQSELERYQAWLQNESAQRALRLLALAHAAVRRQGDPAELPPLHIALIPDGNHADQGFAIETDAGGLNELPTTGYIKLAPQQRTFETTLLHESGHVMLSILSRGHGIPRRDLSAIPHSTAMLTDRGTAFDEGFAIHLETLGAHLATDEVLRGRYHGRQRDFGPTAPRGGEYARPVSDMMTYAQTLARYVEVRDNHFAFAPACRGPDPLRTLLDKSRDFATVRDACQLLQCEGFYASFFFGLTFRGAHPSDAQIAERQRRLFVAMAAMFEEGQLEADTPFLLRIVGAYMKAFPDDAGEVLDVLLDLSHGVFVDAEAATLWREFYDAGLRLDLKSGAAERVKTARAAWRMDTLSDPNLLYSRLGPQLGCEVAACQVRLVALGRASPLRFDLNTVEEGTLRAIPHMTAPEVERWLAERARAPFRDPADFEKRVALRTEARGALNLDVKTEE